jgi:hypothetical protein
MTSSNPTINLNIDPNALPKTSAFTNEVFSSYVKQTISGWKDERLRNLRPLSSFLNRDNITIPKLTEIPKRVSRNLAFYQTNYIVVFLLLSLYGALTNPTFLLILLAVGFAWYILFKRRKEPLKIKNWQVSEKLATAAFCIGIDCQAKVSKSNLVFVLLNLTLSL